MRNLKKVLSLSLALVMLLGMMVVGAGAAVATDYADYGEVSENKQEAMQVITAISVIDGTENGLEPASNLTRAQAAVIVTRALLGRSTADALSSSTCVFSDVPDWAMGAVQYCYDRGIVGGVGGNRFDPNSNVTGQQFAAMLLRAVDPEGDYGGDGWINKVVVGANKNGLSYKVPVTNAALTREDAAQMAFNTIVDYSPSHATAWSVGGLTFDSFIEAYLYQQANGGTIGKTTANDSLAATVFNLTATETTNAFGSAIKNWNFDGEVVATVALNSAVKTYTETATATQVASDLNGYTFGLTKANYLTDGVRESGTASSAATVDTTDEIAALTGNGVRVEVYATNKVINKIVVVKEYVGAVTSVASDGVTVNGKKFDADFARGDVVIYTVANGKIQTMQAAGVVDGVKVTSYTASSVTTDNGVFNINRYKDSTVPSAWSFTEGYTLYLDSYGNVIKVSGANIGAIGTYAYILSASAAAGELGDSAPTVRVRAALSNGTVGVYSASVTTESNGSFTVGGVTVTSSSASNLQSKVFGYSLSGSTITLRATTDIPSGDMTADTVYVGGLNSAYQGGTTINAVNSKSALVNDSTKFVVISGTGSAASATVYTGKINTTSTGLATGTATYVIMRAASNTAGTAAIVFSTSSGNVVGTNAAGYAYVKASDSYNAEGGVYYKALNEDGEVIDLAKNGVTVTDGVYGYTEDNKLINVASEKKGNGAETTVIGDQISAGSGWFDLTDDTLYVYVDTKLSEPHGNNCVVIGDSNGDARVVFVISGNDTESGDSGEEEEPPETGKIWVDVSNLGTLKVFTTESTLDTADGVSAVVEALKKAEYTVVDGYEVNASNELVGKATKGGVTYNFKWAIGSNTNVNAKSVKWDDDDIMVASDATLKTVTGNSGTATQYIRLTEKGANTSTFLADSDDTDTNIKEGMTIETGYLKVTVNSANATAAQLAGLEFDSSNNAYALKTATATKGTGVVAGVTGMKVNSNDYMAFGSTYAAIQAKDGMGNSVCEIADVNSVKVTLVDDTVNSTKADKIVAAPYNSSAAIATLTGSEGTHIKVGTATNAVAYNAAQTLTADTTVHYGYVQTAAAVSPTFTGMTVVWNNDLSTTPILPVGTTITATVTFGETMTVKNSSLVITASKGATITCDVTGVTGSGLDATTKWDDTAKTYTVAVADSGHIGGNIKISFTLGVATATNATPTLAVTGGA